MTLHQTNLCASFCSICLHVILLLSISLLCLQPTITTTAPTNETDRLALLKFKEYIPRDPFNILSSWNDSMHFCNWYGITCGRRHQRVTALDLQGYKLYGSLSPYIGNLSFLRSINLQNNSFYGEIPHEVASLFRLQELIINNNTLEGEIPSSLSNCSHLRTISLGVNKLKGKIPTELGSLMKLKGLGVSINNLTGVIPPSLGNLSSLMYFAVAINNLVGSIPEAIGQLKGLVWFTISVNKLSGLDNKNQSRNLSLLQRLNVAIDVASAIDYLHNHSVQSVIHCDLKPSNVLLDNDMVAHVSDFGLARFLSITNDSSKKQTSTIGIKGSVGYAAPEYGMGGKASIEGDVYSYGILLLEMFLGKRPTDEIFQDGLNLHNFAKMGLPERVVQIVDPILLPREIDATPTAIVAVKEDTNENEIQVDKEDQGITNQFHMDANMHKCLVSILQIGLACSMESPKDRMKMEEVTRELHLIKNAFLGSGIRRGGHGRILV